MRYVIELTGSHAPANLGRKSENLQWLIRKQLRVPRAFVVTWDAFQKYRAKDPALIPDLQKELDSCLNWSLDYAVRSSANVEDGKERSFAGQFETVLNAYGAEAILRAILSIWDKAHNLRLESYNEKVKQLEHPDRTQPNDDVKIAVIIQEMVRPVVSGVSFSCNPVTALDEVVVEAVAGLGTALVQDGITPFRWVNKWGTWLEQASDSPLPINVIEGIVATTERLKREWNREIDLEWVYDGREINWLQLREITSLGSVRVYTNKLSKEMIPGQIKPLVTSTIIPMKVSRIASLLEALSGDQLAQPAQLIKSFHYRIYFEMNAFGRIFQKLGLPRESLEIMFGVYPAPQGRRRMQMNAQMLKHTPRWMRLVWQEWQFAKHFATHFDRVRAQYKAIADTSLDPLNEPQLLDLVGTLNTLHEQTIHANVTIPIFMFLVSGLLRTLLRRHQIDMERIDLGEGLDELAKYHPNVHLAMLRQQFIELDPSVQAEIISGGYGTLATCPAATEFKHNLHAFLENFGHLGDSGNDFTIARWHESQDLILKLIAKDTLADSLPSKPGRLSELLPKHRRSPVFNMVHNRARYFYLQRERVSSLYSLSTGLYRHLFLALGARLCQRNQLSRADDIFYLFEPEVHALVYDTQLEQDWMGLVTQRRSEIEATRDTLMPSVIFGDQLPPLNLQRAKTLNGTPTSRGQYTGTARLVKSLNDFDKLQPGDVLIIPYSDVGWTPLFARAGAVVAESGGMLSHSAIIAREYGIPAVVSVNGALQLTDGIVVTVDGYKGQVFIHESMPN